MADKKPVKSAQETKVDRSAVKIENFKRLATKRVNATLAKLEGVKQLANRNSYTYDSAQVTAILNALKRSVNDIEAAYTSTKVEAKNAFTL
jgi:predicted nucleic acid-binding protein